NGFNSLGTNVNLSTNATLANNNPTSTSSISSVTPFFPSSPLRIGGDRDINLTAMSVSLNRLSGPNGNLLLSATNTTSSGPLTGSHFIGPPDFVSAGALAPPDVLPSPSSTLGTGYRILRTRQSFSTATIMGGAVRLVDPNPAGYTGNLEMYGANVGVFFDSYA